MNHRNLAPHRALPIALSLAAAAFAATPLRAGVIDSLWIGPSGGNWSVAANWDPGVVPDNVFPDAFHVHIDFTGLVNLNQNATISNLTISADATLNINNSRTLIVSNDGPRTATGVIDNAGQINIGSAGSVTVLRMADSGGGPVTLTGGGTVQMSNSTANNIRGIDGGSLINVNNTIRGGGSISSTSSTTALEVINQSGGAIIADAPTTLNLFASIAPFTNEGVLRAQNGAILQVNAGTYDNYGGLIEAIEAGSEVRLSGTAVITGGEISTDDVGLVRASSGSPQLIDVHVLGRVHINNSIDLDTIDTVAHGSIITLASAGSFTTLRPRGGTLTLTGGGEVIMSNHAANNIRSASSAGGTLVNVDNLIRGAGSISSTSSTTRLDAFTNHAGGLVLANVSNSLIIHGMNDLFTNAGVLRAEDGGTLVVSDGPGSAVNTGVMEALGGSELGISGAVIDNAGGVIVAEGAGSQLSLSGNAVITSGELHALGDAIVRITGSTPRLIDVEISGDFIINNSQALELSGAVMVGETNITVNSVGSVTTLRPVGGVPLVLAGGGTVSMSNSSANWIRSVSGETGSLVNVDCTIRGSGNISSTSSTTWLSEIVNHGSIIADQGVVLSVFGAGGPITNTGVLRAESGATLILNAGDYDNTGGLIEALADSEVRLAGTTTITSGELTTAGNGVVRVTSSIPRLIDVTNSGLLHMNNAQTVDLSGTIVNSGMITVNSMGSTTTLRPVNGQVTLTGGGEVIMSNSSVNHIRGVSGDTASLLNIDNTIRGAGHLSSTSSTTWIDIINQGTIVADAAAALQIHGNSPNGFFNDAGGLLEVAGNGGITSSGANFTNAGQIIINEGRAMSRTGDLLQIGGETRINGTLAVSSGSLLLHDGSLAGHGAVNGAVSNSGGTVAPGGSIGTLSIGSFTQSGNGRLRVEIAGATPGIEHDQLIVTGTATLGGRLQPLLDDSFDPMPGDTFTVLTAGERVGTFATVFPCQKVRVIYVDDDAILEYTGVLKVGDLTCSGTVGVPDLLILLGAWGPCPDPDDCPADLTGNGSVGVPDLLALLGNWG